VWDERKRERVLKEETLDTRGVGVWLIEFEFGCFEKEYDFHRFADFHILLDTPTELATDWVLERGGNLPKNVTLEEYRAQVTKNIERYKKYLKECMGEVRYTLTPDKEHRLTLKKTKTEAPVLSPEEGLLLALL
jgi:hypothetical protein